MDNLNSKYGRIELMSKKITFLIDEDVLGIDRYIAKNVPQNPGITIFCCLCP